MAVPAHCLGCAPYAVRRQNGWRDRSRSCGLPWRSPANLETAGQAYLCGKSKHRCATALVVRNQHGSAGAVSPDMRLGCGSDHGEPAGSLIDPKTGDRRADTLADIEHLAVGAHRPHQRAAGGWYLALLGKFTAQSGPPLATRHRARLASDFSLKALSSAALVVGNRLCRYGSEH